MARSMFSPGIFTAFAASIAVRRRGLPPGSPPPLLAATVISRITLVHDDARLASVMAFLRLICFHLLWPAMAELLACCDLVAVKATVRHRNISGAPACGNAARRLLSAFYAIYETDLLRYGAGASWLRIRTANPQRAGGRSGLS